MAIRLVKLSEVDEADNSWVLEGILSGLSLLFGPSGSKKSFLAIAWGAAVATGKAWCGHKTDPTYPGGAPVLYIIGEGGLGPVARRIREALREIGADPKATPFYAVPQAVSIAEPIDAAALREVLEEMDPPPHLVIIDTLSQCMPGDENKQEVMQAFVKACNVIKEDFGCCVLIVHHTPESEANRPRGSTVLLSAVDTAFLVQKDGGARGDVKLKVKKLKDLATTGFHPGHLNSVCVPCLDRNNLPLIDNMGGQPTTLVLRAPPTNVEGCAAVFQVLAGARPDNQAVGYREWMEAYCEATDTQEGMFKIARTEILENVTTHQIEMVARGQYAYTFADTTQPGSNYDTEEWVVAIQKHLDTEKVDDRTREEWEEDRREQQREVEV